MRPLRALVIYIVAVFAGGALVAPWLYWLAQGAARALPHLAFLSQIGHAPFHRFVNRSLLVLALIGLWPLLRSLGATSWREVGLTRLPGQWRKLGGGMVLGFFSLALVAGLALVTGGRVVSPHLSLARIAGLIFGAAVTALVVALLEEILFRGGIFGGLRRVFHWGFALAVSSMIYAIVHFLARPADPAAVTWSSGFAQLVLMLGGFTDWAQIFPGFLNLTLAGVLLGLAYQRTGNLYFSIGLHAGWVFWLRCYGALTTDVPHAGSWFWGTAKMIDGWLALVVLAIALAVVLRLAQKPTHRRELLT